MGIFTSILSALIVGFLIWRLYGSIKQNPQWLSKEALNSSFTTMGILAIILIVFVGFLVVMLRAS